MAKRLIFSVDSPLGYRVILTRDRWRSIIRYKHPALAGQEASVKECLVDPAFVRQSEHDVDVHLHYQPSGKGYVCVVTAPSGSPGQHFVATSYYTRNVKQGADLWTK